MQSKPHLNRVVPHSLVKHLMCPVLQSLRISIHFDVDLNEGYKR
jgi:hypothetical protein